jgi:hypothetical protein
VNGHSIAAAADFIVVETCDFIETFDKLIKTAFLPLLSC